MSHPRPGGRRRGLPVLAPLLAVALGAAGLTFVSGGFSGATSKPGGTASAGPRVAVAEQSPTPPSVAPAGGGVLFDSFDYSGPADPALAAHGWQVRQGAGAPGIKDTWSAAGVTFPQVSTAQGRKALQLQLTTDGTKNGTRQVQVGTSSPKFFTGTLAARVYFSEKPAVGRDGDHINETMFGMSPDSSPSPADYTELDFEYMPDGGWGSTGPELDTTSWRSTKPGDRVTHAQRQNFNGWHTLMITAMNGTVTYSVDGRALFGSHGPEFPRERTDIAFSAWLIDLPFLGARTWNMQVNWVYCVEGRDVPLKDVQAAVDGLYARGSHYVDTMPRS